MREAFVKQMEEELCHVGVTLTEKQMEQFFRYYELLNEWNQVMNLTAITEMSEVVTKHFVDSLALKRAVDGLGDGSSFLGGRCGDRGRFSGYSAENCISGTESDTLEFSE